MWHAAGWGWGFGFVWLLFILLFIGFFVRMLFFRRWGGCGWGPGGRYGYGGFQDHEEVLKHRLAAGEISEEDYQRLRDVLRR